SGATGIEDGCRELSHRVRCPSEILQGASQSPRHAPLVAEPTSVPRGIRLCAEACRAPPDTREQTRSRGLRAQGISGRYERLSKERLIAPGPKSATGASAGVKQDRG